MLHHVADRARGAAELRRVLSPGGRIVLRGCFADRLDGIALFEYFPDSRRIAEEFPSTGEPVSLFRDQGFELVEHRVMRQKLCDGLAELARRARLRTDTTLALLGERAFGRGLAALDRAAAAEATPRPIVEPIDMLVLRAS